MSIVHDHTLLTDFAAYIHALGGEDTSASIIVHIDDFLAARQPPGEPASGIYIPGPEGPIRVDTPCPECRDRPGRVAINGQEVPCNTCGRVWTPDAKERP